MDINCTHPCVYQDDGKCNLSCATSLVTTTHNETDCPYYLGKEKPQEIPQPYKWTTFFTNKKTR